jgi:Ca-activated chloride channel family protein
MFRFLKVLSFTLLLAAAPGTAAHAQAVIIPRPIRPVPQVQPLTVKSQKVTMHVNNGALKVEVEQVFYNPNPVQMEGTYLFPLPAGAAVSNFRMTIDSEPVEGRMLTVEEARRVYESYVRRNIDPAILEYVGRNAFQARVFPIPASGERRIFLGYSQAPDYQDGVYKAVYPLNSERVTGQTAGDMVIDCTIRSSQPLKAVYSPTHEIQVKRESDHLARATFEAKDVRANKDFLLYYTTSDKAFGLNALAHRRIGEDGYAMLMLAPKREAAASEVQPKDVVVVFDTSGSMQGAKIDQARKALLTIIGALNNQDRFNIIRFSSDVASFRPGVVPVNDESRRAARAFVEEFKAIGGTAIDDAIQAGMASIPNAEDRKGRSPFLIFMTDGLPTIGVTEVDRILGSAQKAAPPDLRFFSFGVGSDVNTLLLDKLSADNRGAADYISQDEDLETKIAGFYVKIADPVLSNVKVTVNGATLEEVYPSKIPDLFAGTQLLILGRYKGQGKVNVSLTGELAGKPQSFTYDLTLPERELGNEFIPKLWAGRKIGFLLEQIRLKGENKELKDEVIRLSKEHGIVTPYTAYLVEEPGLAPPGATPLPLVRGAAPGLGGFGGGGRFGAEPDVSGRGAAGLPGPAGPRGPAVPATRSQAGGVQLGDAGKPLQQADEARFYRLEALKREVAQQADGLNRTTGENAIQASRRLKALKDAEQAETEVELTRSIGGRAFRFEKGAWVDETAKGKLRPVAVKYGSEAYFQLVSRRADWARYLSAGKRVQFRSGKTTMVVVGETGKEKLTAVELKGLEN